MPDEPFLRRGWARFGHDPQLVAWLRAALPAAQSAVAAPENAHWLQCQGTWFVGVNVLPNDARGIVQGSGPLRGNAVAAIRAMGLPADNWDRAQVSAVYPGYPRPRTGETPAAFRFRRDRDGAHVDGLLPIGPDRRRMLRERHAFILGLPLTEVDTGASPVVVWEGSHEIIRDRLGAVLRRHPPNDWADVDLTAAYHAARREILAACPRIVIHARPGESYLIHRLALHGVAPWQAATGGGSKGRMVAYFRPELPGPVEDWLDIG